MSNYISHTKIPRRGIRRPKRCIIRNIIRITERLKSLCIPGFPKPILKTGDKRLVRGITDMISCEVWSSPQKCIYDSLENYDGSSRYTLPKGDNTMSLEGIMTPSTVNEYIDIRKS